MENSARQFACGGIMMRIIDAAFQIQYTFSHAQHFDDVGGILANKFQQGASIFNIMNSVVSAITVAGPDIFSFFNNFFQKYIAGIFMNKESGNADGAAKNDLPSFAFRKRIVRDVFMADPACGNIFEGQKIDEILQIDGRPHIRHKAVE